MDYFLIELVNTLRESSAVASARAKKIEQEMVEAGLLPTPTPPAAPSKPRQKTDSNASRTVVPEEEEGLRTRLEAIGLHVGSNFTERYVCQLYI
jgi:hypothetical protein